jgi:RNA polymerase sigma-70 factor (ECF subfamily)
MELPGPPFESPQAFDRLYEQTHLAVYRYIYGLCGGPQEEVEDFTAETFARAWKARRSYTGDPASAQRWLVRIARNLVYDSFRRARNRGEDSEFNEETTLPARMAPGPEEINLAQEQRQKLWQGLQRLPAEPREIIVLRYMLGWQVQEIAAALGVLENTVSQTIRRALQRLRKMMDEDER